MRIRVRFLRSTNSKPSWNYLGEEFRLHGGRSGRNRAKEFTEEKAHALAETLFIDNPRLSAWRIEDDDGSVIAEQTFEEWEEEG